MILDSSVILQVLLGQKQASDCRKKIDWKHAAIPTLCVFEIYKKLRTKLTEDECLEAMSPIRSLPLLDLPELVALTAADLSIEYRLGMADAIVLAHARVRNQILLTLDYDFAGIPGVIRP